MKDRNETFLSLMFLLSQFHPSTLAQAWIGPAHVTARDAGSLGMPPGWLAT